MAVSTRVTRGERPPLIMPESADLDPDEALVGGSDDSGSGIRITDAGDDNPYADLKDEDWDGLSDDERAKRPQTPRREARQTDAPPPREADDGGDFEEDVRLAYDDPAEGGAGERGGGRRSRRNRSRRSAIDSRDEIIQQQQARLQELEQSINRLNGSQIGATARDLDFRLSNAQRALQIADAQLAEAINESKGNDAVLIQRERDRLYAEVWELDRSKRQLEAHVQQMRDGGSAGAAPQPTAPRMTAEQQQQVQQQEADFQFRRDTFLDRYPWFDPESGAVDQDHRIVLDIDAELADEGLQRHTKAYWHQMERRMREAGFRPEAPAQESDERRGRRFDDERDDRRDARRYQNGGGVNGGGRRYNGPPTAAVNSTRRPGNGDGRGYALSEIELQMLQDEGLTEPNLTEAEEAKKTRLINKWKAGKEAYQRQTGRRF